MERFLFWRDIPLAPFSCTFVWTPVFFNYHWLCLLRMWLIILYKVFSLLFGQHYGENLISLFLLVLMYIVLYRLQEIVYKWVFCMSPSLYHYIAPRSNLGKIRHTLSLSLSFLSHWWNINGSEEPLSQVKRPCCCANNYVLYLFDHDCVCSLTMLSVCISVKMMITVKLVIWSWRDSIRLFDVIQCVMKYWHISRWNMWYILN